MNIAIRLFLGFFLIVGLAAWFILNIALGEIEPGVRQAAEDTMVDMANLLAEQVDDVTAGDVAHGRFSKAVQSALQRSPRASIYGVDKEELDLRIYMTDASGIVVYDSEDIAVGADYSHWRDVERVLHGEYGARSTREDPTDPGSSFMYVAAPVMRTGRLVGVITVAKPMASLTPYTKQAQLKVQRAGIALLTVSTLIGLLFTGWLTWSLNRLRDYARAIAEGHKATAPTTGGRQLSELAKALALMRDRLDGKQYVENYVQSLTHEIKSPLTAVRAAAELLHENPNAEDRQRFIHNISEQTERMQQIVERLLLLARIEQLQLPEEASDVALVDLVRTSLTNYGSRLAERRLTPHIDCQDNSRVVGDSFLLQQAVDNLIDNAIDFSPDGSPIVIALTTDDKNSTLSVRDCGPGAPAFAVAHIFERFYSLARPLTGKKGTGLGLAFVREVAKIHGGTVTFNNVASGGALVQMTVSRNATR